MAQVTLKSGIEGMLKHYIPEVWHGHTYPYNPDLPVSVMHLTMQFRPSTDYKIQAGTPSCCRCKRWLRCRTRATRSGRPSLQRWRRSCPCDADALRHCLLDC